jgi:hypothetical protein
VSLFFSLPVTALFGATLGADGIHSKAAKPIVNVFERNAG